jgi:hypothetical protein
MLQSIERQDKQFDVSGTQKNSSILISDINQVFFFYSLHYIILKHNLLNISGYARCRKRKSVKNEPSIGYAILAMRRCSTAAFSRQLF